MGNDGGELYEMSSQSLDSGRPRLSVAPYVKSGLVELAAAFNLKAGGGGNSPGGAEIGWHTEEKIGRRGGLSVYAEGAVGADGNGRAETGLALRKSAFGHTMEIKAGVDGVTGKATFHFGMPRK